MNLSSGRQVIRNARQTDAIQLARIYTDSFGPTTSRDVKRSMNRKDFPAEIMVAVVDGVVAAAITILHIDFVVDGVTMRTGGIAGVATRWDYRRRGLATSLLRESIKRLKSEGIPTSMLFTGVQLPAKRIYRRLGYTETSQWLRFSAMHRPVDVVKRSFDFRGRWFTKTRYARPILQSWTERVLIEGDGWCATITCDGKKFKVEPGRRGRPTLTMKGDTRSIFNCFWNKDGYDRNLKAKRLRVSGSRDARDTWRRIVTMEWVE